MFTIFDVATVAPSTTTTTTTTTPTPTTSIVTEIVTEIQTQTELFTKVKSPKNFKIKEKIKVFQIYFINHISYKNDCISNNISKYK